VVVVVGEGGVLFRRIVCIQFYYLGEVTDTGLALDNGPLFGGVLAVGDGHAARVDKRLLLAELVLGADRGDDCGAFLGASRVRDGQVPNGALLQVAIIGAVTIADLGPALSGVLALRNGQVATVDKGNLSTGIILSANALNDRGTGLGASGNGARAIKDSTLLQVAIVGAVTIADLGPALSGVLALRNGQAAAVDKGNLSTGIVLSTNALNDRGTGLGASGDGARAIKDATLNHAVVAGAGFVRDLGVDVVGVQAVGL
jgi:hypothetical protein